MIQRSVDKEEIGRIINHPDVFSWLTDDISPQYYEPVINPHVIYLINESKEGLVRLDPVNGITCSVHIATTPAMWGNVDKFVKDVIAWGFSNTKFLKAVAFIPAYNDRALKIAKRVGFSQEGVLKKSFLKNWKLHDQIVFGLCKGDVTCQQ